MDTQKKITIIGVSLFIVFAGYLVLRSFSQQAMPSQDQLDQLTPEVVSENEIGIDLLDEEYAAVAELEDVSLGPVRGVSTEGLATGTIYVSIENGRYELEGVFEDLPQPQGSDFYEGWLVRLEPFEAVSTGKLILEENEYANYFVSTENLKDYTRYVLTLEPDDDDPAPGEHILQGDFVEINQ